MTAPGRERYEKFVCFPHTRSYSSGMSNPHEIAYGRGGDTHATVAKAIEGHPIRVTGQASVFTLYHALERRPEVGTHTMVFKKIASDVWRVFVVPRAALTGSN